MARNIRLCLVDSVTAGLLCAFALFSPSIANAGTASGEPIARVVALPRTPAGEAKVHVETGERIALAPANSSQRLRAVTASSVQPVHLVREPAAERLAFEDTQPAPRVTVVGQPLVSDRVTADRAFAAGPFLDFRALVMSGVIKGLPLSGRRISSSFGSRYHPILGGTRFHAGIDIAAAAGTPVHATANGTVIRASWYGSYGLFVAVDHGGGKQTRYAHLSHINVSPGQSVKKGDIVGYVGSTGRSTGPHLHYEVRENGRAVDPLATGAR